MADGHPDRRHRFHQLHPVEGVWHTRREVAGFLGGLVNSTVTVTELAARTRDTGGRLTDVAYRGVLLPTAAMAARNAVLVGILVIGALANSTPPLVLMLRASLALSRRPRANSSAGEAV